MLHGHGVVGVVGCPDELCRTNGGAAGRAGTCRAGGDGFAKTKEHSLLLSLMAIA